MVRKLCGFGDWVPGLSAVVIRPAPVHATAMPSNTCGVLAHFPSKNAVGVGVLWIRTEKQRSYTNPTEYLLLFSMRLFGGSPAWIRTTIHGSKGRCPTVRRPGKTRKAMLHSVYPSARSQATLPPPAAAACSGCYNLLRKPHLAGAGRGLQTRCAVLCIAGGFDSHWLPPSLIRLGYPSL